MSTTCVLVFVCTSLLCSCWFFPGCCPPWRCDCSLVVPVVRNADALSFAQVEGTLANLANKVCVAGCTLHDRLQCRGVLRAVRASPLCGWYSSPYLQSSVGADLAEGGVEHYMVTLCRLAYSLQARTNSIAIEEMIGGTFTISNGGVFGSMMGTPIINLPQVRVRCCWLCCCSRPMSWRLSVTAFDLRC